jgi:hypothetical protein
MYVYIVCNHAFNGRSDDMYLQFTLLNVSDRLRWRVANETYTWILDRPQCVRNNVSWWYWKEIEIYPTVEDLCTSIRAFSQAVATSANISSWSIWKAQPSKNRTLTSICGSSPYIIMSRTHWVRVCNLFCRFEASSLCVDRHGTEGIVQTHVAQRMSVPYSDGREIT